MNRARTKILKPAPVQVRSQCVHKWTEWNAIAEKYVNCECFTFELCPVCHHCGPHCPGHAGLHPTIKCIRGKADAVTP